jgi:hypothetical protein
VRYGYAADHCPNLRALALAQCSGLNDEALPHLAAMPKLAELTIRGAFLLRLRKE